MRFSTNKSFFVKKPSGFSLIEIMVAMVIGLLGIIVMMQVFSVFEGQKRTTTGGGDAQNSGAIALYGLQRDIRQSGYGISTQDLLGCDVLLRAGITLNNMAPVTINHASITGQDANTDTLLVVYGNGNGGAEGDGVNGTPPAANTYPVQTPTSFIPGDRVIATLQVRPSPCAGPTKLVLDTLASVLGPNVSVVTGVAGITYGSKLYDLGQAPKVQAYAIRNGNLTVCDYMVNDCGLAANNTNTAIWVPIANNVVSMRAQYGHDNSAAGFSDGIVDGYDQITPSSASATFACDWLKVSALSLVLVARNGQPAAVNGQPTVVTAAAPTWVGSTSATPVLIDLTLTTAPPGFDWHNYRYKVFETNVPLRNITALGAVKGC